MTCLYH